MTRIGLRSEDYGAHLLRRTTASIIYKQTGNLRAVQIYLSDLVRESIRWLILEMKWPLRLFVCRYLELRPLMLTVVPTPVRPLSPAFFWMALLPDRSRSQVLFPPVRPVTSRRPMESLYAKAAPTV